MPSLVGGVRQYGGSEVWADGEEPVGPQEVFYDLPSNISAGAGAASSLTVRPVEVRVGGLVWGARGSSLVTVGGTTVVAAGMYSWFCLCRFVFVLTYFPFQVHGPGELTAAARRRAATGELSVDCEVVWPPGVSPTTPKGDLAGASARVLAGVKIVILGQELAHLRVRITCTVVTDDGGVEGVSLMAACIALCHAGVPVRDIYGCTEVAVLVDGTLIVEPSKAIISSSVGLVRLSLLKATDQVGTVHSSGVVPMDMWVQAVAKCVQRSNQVHGEVSKAVRGWATQREDAKLQE